MIQKLFGIALAICFLLASTSASAVESGDSVTFLIPADNNQPDPPSGPTDKLIFTGGRVATTDVTGCGTGSRPLQNAVLVDPAGGRSGRLIGVIVVSESEALPPGTKLTSLSANGSCTIGSTLYNRYLGTVD